MRGMFGTFPCHFLLLSGTIFGGRTVMDLLKKVTISVDLHKFFGFNHFELFGNPCQL